MTTNEQSPAAAGAPAAIGKPSLSSGTNLSIIAQHMYVLMMRNISSDGFLIDDPVTGTPSRPGCMIAAPSYPSHTPGVDQDYVFNWVRDAAITAMELAAAQVPDDTLGGAEPLDDYVTFARLCQQNAQPTLGHACFTVGGQSRPWTEQSDGPALQTLAVMHAYKRLDPAVRPVADELIRVNLGYLLAEYRNPTTNLWEEHAGLSFFTRSVQLRCFRDVAANSLGIPVPAGVAEAIAWLTDALPQHWNGTCYLSMLAAPGPGEANRPALTADVGYDPNIDIVCACIYGAIEATDPRLLATAALLRNQWADPASPSFYPVNGADNTRGLGPLLGRYPGDYYDGDMQDHQRGGHPWPLCTSNFAELYYRVANAITSGATVPFDHGVSRDYFTQVGIAADTPPPQAADLLRAAGDRMLRAVVFHSDHLELSEQFDGTSGYEKSVTNLTWSYAAFLSAVRARTGKAVLG